MIGRAPARCYPQSRIAIGLIWKKRGSACVIRGRRRAPTGRAPPGIWLLARERVVVVGWVESSRPTTPLSRLVGLEDSTHPTRTGTTTGTVYAGIWLLARERG